MLFMIPGLEETMRVNGIASISTDSEIRNLCTDGDRVPNLAIIVNVKTCFMHCGKALRRSDMWNISSWPSADERPSGAELRPLTLTKPNMWTPSQPHLKRATRQLCGNRVEVRNFSPLLCCFETQISVIAYSHDLQIRPSAIHNREVRSPEQLVERFRSEGLKITPQPVAVLTVT